MPFGDSDELDTEGKICEEIHELRDYVGNRMDGLAEVERECAEHVVAQREAFRATYARMVILTTVKQISIALIVCAALIQAVKTIAEAFGHR